MPTPLKKLPMRMTAMTLSADQSLMLSFFGACPAGAGAAAADCGAGALALRGRQAGRQMRRR